MQPNNHRPVLPILFLIMSANMLHAQSSIEIYQRRVSECMGDPSSPQYASDICVAFRDGVIYARDALKGSDPGNITRYNPYPQQTYSSVPQVLKPLDQETLIDDMLRQDGPTSTILSVDPQSGTVSATPVPVAPPAAAPQSLAPYLQQVR